MIKRIRNSITGLFSEWKEEAKTFVREEIQLIKAELSEKAAYYGKHSVGIVLGGLVAYAGSLLFLGGLGVLLAYAFRTSGSGMDPLLAGFLGLGIVGLVALAVGAVLLLNGIKAMKQENLVPEQAVRSLQRLGGAEPAAMAEPEPAIEDTRSSEQIAASVAATQARQADIMDELADRVSLNRARERALEEVQRHPFRWGLIAAGCGAAGSYLFRRNHPRRAE